MLSATLRHSSRRLALRRPILTARYTRPEATAAVQQVWCSYFSTDSEKKKEEAADSLRDTVNRLKHDEESTKNDKQVDDLLRRAADVWETAKTEIGLTWQELVNAGKPKSINKKIHPTETEEGNQEYTGPVDIMVIDESEHLTAWERMQRRLTEAPIIQGEFSVL